MLLQVMGPYCACICFKDTLRPATSYGAGSDMGALADLLDCGGEQMLVKSEDWLAAHLRMPKERCFCTQSASTSACAES